MRISGKSFALAAALVGAATSAFAADTKTKVKPDVSCPPAWGSQDFPPYVAPAINGWDPLHLGYMKYKLDPAREDRAVCETPVPNAALGFSVSNEKEICFPVNSIPDVRVLTLRTATGVRLLPFSLSYKGVKLAYAVYERKCRGESDAAPIRCAPIAGKAGLRRAHPRTGAATAGPFSHRRTWRPFTSAQTTIAFCELYRCFPACRSQGFAAGLKTVSGKASMFDRRSFTVFAALLVSSPALAAITVEGQAALCDPVSYEKTMPALGSVSPGTTQFMFDQLSNTICQVFMPNREQGFSRAIEHPVCYQAGSNIAHQLLAVPFRAPNGELFRFFFSGDEIGAEFANYHNQCVLKAHLKPMPTAFRPDESPFAQPSAMPMLTPTGTQK